MKRGTRVWWRIGGGREKSDEGRGRRVRRSAEEREEC